MENENPITRLDRAYQQAMAAKEHIFKAQDSANYVEGLDRVETALAKLRADLEAFDRLCRTERDKLITAGHEVPERQIRVRCD